MPVYDYQCDSCGKKMTSLNSMLRRQYGPECCGEPSTLKLFGKKRASKPIEKPGKIKVIGDIKNIFNFRDVTCRECGFRFETDCTNEDGDYDPMSAEDCFKCGSSNLMIHFPIPRIDRFSERFPYYDRGLGQWLTSKSHRRSVCKEKGVIPVDGDLDFSADIARRKKQEAEDDKLLSGMRDKLDNHEGFAQYRELKDKGWKPNFKHRKQKKTGV